MRAIKKRLASFSLFILFQAYALVASAGMCNFISAFMRDLEAYGTQVHPAYQQVDYDGATRFLDSLTNSGETFLPRSRLPEPSIEDLMKEGGTFQQAAETALKGDMDAARHFDPATGKFAFRPSGAGSLAAEDGTAKLDVIRINFSDETNLTGHRTISEELIKDYGNALKEMPGLELWVLANPWRAAEVEKMISRFPKEVRSRIKIAPSKVPLSLWAQDGSKPLERGRSTLVRTVPGAPARTKQEADWLAQQQSYVASIQELSRVKLATVEASPLAFEGGNVIVGKDDIFVGTNIVQSVMRQFKITRQEAKAALATEFGKPIIEIGVPSYGTRDYRQLGFHIDLDMALVRSTASKGGKGTAVVQSPSKFLEETFGFPPVRELNVESFTQEKLRALKAMEAKALAGKPFTAAERTLVSLLHELPYEAVVYEEKAADYIARQVAAAGYDVRRVPGTGATNTNATNASSQRYTVSALPFYSYTNVVVSGNRVLIPQYGIEALDRAARRVYEDLGYETVPMRAARDSICFQGATRCTSETYRRSGPRQAPPARSH